MITRTENQLTVTGFKESEFSVALTKGAEVHCQVLLETAALVTSISSVSEQEIAGDSLRALRGWAEIVDESRIQAKRPFLEAKREIEAVAKEASAPVEREIKRLTDLIKAFYDEQERIIREMHKEQERVAEEAKRAQANPGSTRSPSGVELPPRLGAE